MEYHGKFGHTLVRIQHITLRSRIDICYATCCIANQTLEPNIPGLQSIKLYVQYLASYPLKPISYPSNSYNGSNIIRLTWSGNNFEDYTTQSYL